MPITATNDLPAASLLQAYRDRRAYTDCFYTDLPHAVSLPDYIDAFYTTWLFKLERLVLATLIARPSTDAQASALANGEQRRFAAWNLEGRSDDQILMCDYQSKTRSWLMCAPLGGATRLYFGSAVVPARIRPDGSVDFGLGFNQLIGPHRFYSVALLKATAAKLRSK